MKTKEYTNEEVTVVWKPDLCIHSGKCVQGLPGVFDPKERPWVNVQGATSEEILRQVNNCPSGALSGYYNHQTTDTQMSEETSTTNIEVFSNGPIRIPGPCTVALADGSTEEKEKDVFLCRCGASSNKPYCDGTHKRIGFEG